MMRNQPWLKKLALQYPINDLNLPFRDYITQSQALIEAYRLDLHKNRDRIVEANSPFEFIPVRPIPSSAPGKLAKYGVLFTHGMFDCPFSLKDLGLHLQANGILSRGILLPGHGITPGCLATATHQEWLQTVRYGVETLLADVEQVFLVGYSMGAALSLCHALKNPRIAGLILLTPCLELQFAVDVLVNLHRGMSLIKNHADWLLVDQEVDYIRYQSVPLHAVQELHTLLNYLKSLHPPAFSLPRTLMVATAQDEVISTKTAINYFQNQLHGPQHQCLLYTAKDLLIKDERIQLRSSVHPELHIQSFSHVSIPISPDNFHYGQNGDYLYTSRLDGVSTYSAVNRIAEKYYRFLYKSGLIKRPIKELTYNPDFLFQAQKITDFICAHPETSAK